MQITDPLGQLFFPPAMVGLWFFLTWIWGRTVRAGNPLTPSMKRGIFYAALFLLGLLYLLAWNDEIATAISWPGKAVWIPLTIIWGVVLAYLALRQYRRQRLLSDAPSDFRYSSILGSLIKVGLLIAMIGAVLEWVFVIEKEGHLWLALLWTAGCGLMIFLAKNDRRDTVLLALRLLVLLALLGAIGHPSVTAGIVVVGIGIALLLTQKLWKRNSVSSIS